MKKIQIILLFALFLGIKASAQDYTRPELKYGIHPGTITTTDGQTIKGYIINSDDDHNQNQCVFYTDYEDKSTKKVYGPLDLAGYTIENNQYKSVSYSGNIGFGKANRNFLYVARPGAITTFIYWGNTKQMVWQKGDKEPFSDASMLLGFRKTMLKLVGDDTELAEKIDQKQKGYGMLNLTQIIDEYNTWAQSKK